MVMSRMLMIRSLLASLLGLGLIVLGLPLATYAQDNGATPQLPEIAPREFEIRGQAQVSFPSLERQPLRGFVTQPRLPTLPPQRIPFTDTEAYTQALDVLPDPLPDAPAVSSRLHAGPPPSRGSLSADLGRYLTRSVDGVLALPLSDTETLDLQVTYKGSSGHTAFNRTDTETPYDNLHGRVRVESRRERFQLHGDLHGLIDDYTLYGAQRPVGIPVAASIPDRTGRSIGTTLGLSTDTSLPIEVGLRFDHTTYETTPDENTPDRSLDESRLALDGAVQFPVGITNVRLDATVATAGLNNGTFAGDMVAFDGGGDALAVRIGPYRVRAGARVLAFQALRNPADPARGEATATFIAPTFDALWTPRSALEVYARNTPRLRMHDLPMLFRRNPFLDAIPSVRPSLETTNLESGVSVTTGPVRWTAFAGFRYAPSYLHFVPGPAFNTSTGPVRGTFSAAYDGAQMWRGGGALALEGLSRWQTTLRFELRNPTRTDTDRAVPNVSSFMLEHTSSATFVRDKLRVSLHTTLEGPRYIDAQETEQVDAFFDLDVNAAYAVTPLIDVRLGLHNLGAMERWNRYPRPPAILTTGLRIHW
mgnify:CR=1 FL=1